jgi:hypothetical protein
VARDADAHLTVVAVKAGRALALAVDAFPAPRTVVWAAWRRAGRGLGHARVVSALALAVAALTLAAALAGVRPGPVPEARVRPVALLLAASQLPALRTERVGRAGAHSGRQAGAGRAALGPTVRGARAAPALRRVEPEDRNRKWEKKDEKMERRRTGMEKAMEREMKGG